MFNNFARKILTFELSEITVERLYLFNLFEIIISKNLLSLATVTILIYLDER